MSNKTAPKKAKREKPLSGKDEAATCAQGLQRRYDSPTCLEDQLRFETLVSELSARFVNIAPDQVDGEIEHALEHVLEFFQVDRCGLLGLSPDRKRLHVTHAAYDEGIERIPGDVDLARLFPWSHKRLVIQKKYVSFSKLSELPPEAEKDRQSWTATGVQSLLVIPLFFEGSVSSLIVISSLRRQRSWPEEYIPRLRLLGEIFINALERRQDRLQLEEQLRFEMLLVEISGQFVNLPADQVDCVIEDAQRRVCECLELDLSALWQWSVEPPRIVTMTHVYRPLGGPPLPEPMYAHEHFPWCQEQLEAGRKINVSSMDSLPPEAARDQEVWRHFGIKSSLTIPLSSGGGPIVGALSFNTMQQERTWPEPLIKRIQLVAQMFTSALVRKQAETTLRESEARLSLATEAVGAGLWIMDVDNSRVWVSPKSRELFHFGPDEEIHYENYFRVIHPEDRDRVHQDVQQALRSGKTLNCDYRIVLPDGSIRWIVARGQRFLKSTGEPDRIMGLSLDITDRKRAEAALEESRTQIAAVMNSTKDFIWSVDPERFGLLTWNRAFRDYFFEQRGIELATGMTPAELVPPDYVPLWHGLFSRALREELVVTEYVVVAQTITLLLSLQVMKKGDQVFGISVFGKDITERKRAEQELRQSEERFRQVAESVGDFIWEVDANGLYRYTSPAVVKILGYTPDELIGKMHFYDLFAPEVREELKAAAFKVFVAKNSFRAFPNANMSKDGKIVHLETSGVPVLDEAGNLVGYRGSDTDITERKKMQEQLRTAAEEWYKTFNTIQDMIMIMDRKFRIVQVNDAAIKFFGLPKERIIGAECFRLMHGTESPIDGCPYKKMMDTRCHEETEVYDTERDMWFHIVVDPLLDEMGDIIGVVHTVKDITERKQAEAAPRRGGNLRRFHLHLLTRLPGGVHESTHDRAHRP